jgi:hypothetical protein
MKGIAMLKADVSLRRRSVAVVISCVAVTVPLVLYANGATASAFAADKKIQLTSDGPATFWSGTLYRDGDHSPDVPECSQVNCDHVLIKVQLPQSVWSRDGGIEISNRWSTGMFDDAVGLYVYRNDKRVAKSDALVATAQGVEIPFNGADPSGNYHVYVAYNSLPNSPDTTSASIPYQGVTEVEYHPARNPQGLLPDMMLLPSDTITFDRPDFSVFEPAPPPGQNCFDSEIAEDGAVRCLREDIKNTNVGLGNLDIRFQRPAGSPPVDGEQIPVTQRIYRSYHKNALGMYDDYFDRPTGGFVTWHAIHQHWHFVDYSSMNVYAVDASGRIVGTPLTGNKPSFCIATTRLDGFGTKGNGPSDYPAPDCLSPDKTENGVDYFKQGITHGGGDPAHPGWGDTYDWYLNGQYVNIPLGTPDGRYVMVMRIDPKNRFLESKDNNNCIATYIELNNLNTSTPQVQKQNTVSCPTVGAPE